MTRAATTRAPPPAPSARRRRGAPPARPPRAAGRSAPAAPGGRGRAPPRAGRSPGRAARQRGEGLRPRATERAQVHRQVARRRAHRAQVDRVRALAEEEHPPKRALAAGRCGPGPRPPAPRGRAARRWCRARAARSGFRRAAPAAPRPPAPRGWRRPAWGFRGPRELEPRQRHQVSDEQRLAEHVVRARRERLGDGATPRAGR